MRILYVEDNPANLFLVKRVARGHEVINYIDGEDALANFDADKPDLVLMDIQLAGHLSGLEVVRKLRSAGHTTPIIAVTAYAMVGDREQCMAAGCDDYIAKPLQIPRLVEMFDDYDKRSQVSQVVISDTDESEAEEESLSVEPEAAVSDVVAAVTEDAADTEDVTSDTEDVVPKIEDVVEDIEDSSDIENGAHIDL
jgi:CheY-like chemotaxis protein